MKWDAHAPVVVSMLQYRNDIVGVKGVLKDKDESLDCIDHLAAVGYDWMAIMVTEELCIVSDGRNSMMVVGIDSNQCVVLVVMAVVVVHLKRVLMAEFLVVASVMMICLLVVFEDEVDLLDRLLILWVEMIGLLVVFEDEVDLLDHLMTIRVKVVCWLVVFQVDDVLRDVIDLGMKWMMMMIRWNWQEMVGEEDPPQSCVFSF